MWIKGTDDATDIEKHPQIKKQKVELWIQTLNVFFFIRVKSEIASLFVLYEGVLLRSASPIFLPFAGARGQNYRRYTRKCTSAGAGQGYQCAV